MIQSSTLLDVGGIFGVMSDISKLSTSVRSRFLMMATEISVILLSPLNTEERKDGSSLLSELLRRSFLALSDLRALFGGRLDGLLLDFSPGLSASSSMVGRGLADASFSSSGTEISSAQRKV
uniref:Uncharacterized protein n=1 Tax=Octopus bimaculoides TaxID=37653 RepID=A0A0L8HXP2_OCTBM